MRIKIKKTLGRGVPEIGDIRISINKNGGKVERYSLAVTFMGDNYKKVTTTSYIVPSIDYELNRLYFESSDSTEGFKLSLTRDTKMRPRIQFTIENKIEWESRCGSYNLLYDTREQLYYVDLNNQIKM